MALSSIPIPPDVARDTKAAELVKTAHAWPVVTLRKDWGAFKAGDQFRQTPNGYRVNAVVCECIDYKRGHICKHMRAYVMLEQRPAIRPVRARFEDLYPPTCQASGCTDDAERGELFCTRHQIVDAF